MKNGNKQIYVTTPQGTVPLNEYGSFQPQFVPMFNRGEMLGDLGNGDKILGEWNPEHKGSLTSVCRDIAAKALKNELAHPNKMPLPSLEAINANVKDSFIVRMKARRTHEAMMEVYGRELRKMSDHELNVFINLARTRSNGVYGNSRLPSQVELDKYIMAIEERSRRKDASS